MIFRHLPRLPRPLPLSAKKRIQKELARGSVQETLNELLEQEAEKLSRAARYGRNEACQGLQKRSLRPKLTISSGDITLHMSRLNGISFETAIIGRYQRRESPVEEALIEMYLAGGIRPESGGYYRGAVGQQGVPRYDQQSEQKGLRPYRRMAAAQAPVRVSLCLSGRHLSQAKLGRRI